MEQEERELEMGLRGKELFTQTGRAQEELMGMGVGREPRSLLCS